METEMEIEDEEEEKEEAVPEEDVMFTASEKEMVGAEIDEMEAEAAMEEPEAEEDHWSGCSAEEDHWSEVLVKNETVTVEPRRRPWRSSL